MRIRTLLAIVLVLFAIPALASDPLGLKDAPKANPDTLVAIADVQTDAAFDERTSSKAVDELLDSARTNYQKALHIDPKHKDALRGLARLYARVGECEKSVETYKKYFALYPNDRDAAHEVAIAHARWKDWEGAVAWCAFTLKIDPENRSVKKTLGFCQAMAGQWDAAFTTLCKIMPEAQARHNIAGLLKETGHQEAAKQQLELALKADPNFAPAREMLAAVEKGALSDADKARLRDVVVAGSFPLGVEGTQTGAKLTSVQVEVPGRCMNALFGAVIAHSAVREPKAYHLRRASATGAADSVSAFFALFGLKVKVIANVENNLVLIHGDLAVQRNIAELLKELDKPQPQVILTALVVKAPRAFISQSGLNAGGSPDATSWTLSPREVRMFTELLRAAKGRGEIDVLSRPQICINDKQTVWVEIGQTQQGLVPAGGVLSQVLSEPAGIKIEFVPNVSADGSSVSLAVNGKLTEGSSTWSLRATESLRFGEALVVASSKSQSLFGKLGCLCGDPFVTLMIVAPSQTAPADPIAALREKFKHAVESEK